jgi:hypothetical protein
MKTLFNFSGNLKLDVYTLMEDSREVGYQNAKANQKDEDDEYNLDEIEKYEDLRLRQLEFYEKFQEKYLKSDEKSNEPQTP